MERTMEEVTSRYTQNPVTMKIERVAAYVRVSTQEQKLHGISLDAQKAKLTEYAANHGMRIVEWYIDEGVSGRKLIRKRPELQRMIQDAEKGKFDRIIFIKLDRFFRSVAEYHECMKRIAPVIWTATEEKYDLSTATGRSLVNFKLTIAEMEADTGSERVLITNDYKVSTGQPLSGSQPFGYTIERDTSTGRKKIIRDPETEEMMYDLIEHYKTYQSKRGTVMYMNAKHHISMSYTTISRLLTNTMLYGAYRDNPAYCESYITKDEFDRLQDIIARNVKKNTADNRAYYFSGLIKCPVCGTRLKSNYVTQKQNGKIYYYKKYRCSKNRMNGTCDYAKVISENVLERMLLDNMGKYLADAKARALEVQDANSVKVPEYDIEAINGEIDRLNYSWQTGKIRKVEQYEKDFAALMEKLEKAEAERDRIEVKDFSQIEAVLHAGWKEIYKNLDDAHKRAFWRSFIRSIEIEWTTGTKEITRVNFF